MFWCLKTSKKAIYNAKKMQLQMKNETIEVPPQSAVFMTDYLLTLRNRLGVPKELTEADMNDVAWKFIDEMLRMWKSAYPYEYLQFVEEVNYTKQTERSVKEAVKGGGFSPIMWPERFFQLMKVFLPNVRLSNKAFVHEFVLRHPDFKSTNYL